VIAPVVAVTLGALLSLAACSSADTPTGEDDGGATSSSSSSASSSSTGGPGDAGCFVSAEGPRQGGAAASVARASGVAWQTTANALAADDAVASVVLDGAESSEELRITGFKLGIPATAKIVGVGIELKRQAEGGVLDGAMTLLVPGQTTATRNYGPTWPTKIIGTHTYGGATETWGATLTAEAVNSPDFGASLWVKRDPASATATAKVDAIRITIHYCP
jgi:hypothetical protein